MTSGGRGSRRQANPTAAAIYRAAVELFYKQGYAATTLRQIADRVGLQVGSLYNHITSKEDLLHQIMQGILDDLIVTTRAAMNGLADPLERVEAFMVVGVSFHGTHRRETFIGNTEQRALAGARRRSVISLRRDYERLLETAVKEAVAAGRLSVRDERMCVFAGLAICTDIARWYPKQRRLAVAEIAECLVTMYTPVAVLHQDR